MKKTILIILLILDCCFMNQFLAGQELSKIWETEVPSLEIEQTANLKRNASLMDLDGDGNPEIVGVIYRDSLLFIRFSTGDIRRLWINDNSQSIESFQFAGFYRFFESNDGLKQMLMVRREGNKIIGILVGVIGEDTIDFNTPVPDDINDNNSSVININDWNKNNFEEIKVTFQDLTSSTTKISIWEYEQ